jgi:hypothetical protein
VKVKIPYLLAHSASWSGFRCCLPVDKGFSDHWTKDVYKCPCTDCGLSYITCVYVSCVFSRKLLRPSKDIKFLLVLKHFQKQTFGVCCIFMVFPIQIGIVEISPSECHVSVILHTLTVCVLSRLLYIPILLIKEVVSRVKLLNLKYIQMHSEYFFASPLCKSVEKMICF